MRDSQKGWFNAGTSICKFRLKKHQYWRGKWERIERDEQQKWSCEFSPANFKERFSKFFIDSWEATTRIWQRDVGSFREGYSQIASGAIDNKGVSSCQDLVWLMSYKTHNKIILFGFTLIIFWKVNKLSFFFLFPNYFGVILFKFFIIFSFYQFFFFFREPFFKSKLAFLIFFEYL